MLGGEGTHSWGPSNAWPLGKGLRCQAAKWQEVADLLDRRWSQGLSLSQVGPFRARQTPPLALGREKEAERAPFLKCGLKAGQF